MTFLPANNSFYEYLISFTLGFLLTIPYFTFNLKIFPASIFYFIFTQSLDILEYITKPTITLIYANLILLPILFSKTIPPMLTFILFTSSLLNALDGPLDITYTIHQPWFYASIASITLPLSLFFMKYYFIASLLHDKPCSRQYLAGFYLFMIGLVMMLYPFQVGFAKPTSIMNVILEMIKPVFITGLVEKFNFDCGLVMVILFQNLVRMVDNFFMADFVSVVNYLWIRTGSIGMVISGLLLVKICLEARKSYEFFNYQYSRLRILLFVIGIGVFILLQAYVINPGQVYLERLDRFKIEDPRLEYKRLFENGVLQRPWLGYDYELIGKRVRLWKDTKDLQLRQKMETIMFPWIKPTFSSTEELRNYGEGEGIVISVPDRYVKDALSTLRMIRQVLKCDLPVEVFFLGDTDLSTNNQRLLETIPNVKTVDLNKLFDTAILNVKGFGLKPFCILGSSFNNVILIDADVVFLQSPSQLFKTKEFEQTAALFFWDRQLLGDWDPLLNQKLFIKSVLDRPLRQTVKDMDIFEGTTFNTQESGVVVIDKSKGIEALMAVCLLNVGKLREEVYKIINGDKETFWIGYEIVEAPYAFTEHISGAMGTSHRTQNGGYELCSTQILHLDNDKNPLWFNGGLLVNKNLHEKNSGNFIDLNEWMTELDGEWVYYHGGGGCLRTRRARTKPVLFTDTEKSLFKQIAALYEA